MQVLLKMVALIVCGVVTTVVITVGVASWDGAPGWFVLLIAASPFVGTFLGGWLVSRHSTSGGKVGWVLGGGLGFGILIWLGLLVLFAIVAFKMCADAAVC